VKEIPLLFRTLQHTLLYLQVTFSNDETESSHHKIKLH